MPPVKEVSFGLRPWLRGRERTPKLMRPPARVPETSPKVPPGGSPGKPFKMNVPFTSLPATQRVAFHVPDAEPSSRRHNPAAERDPSGLTEEGDARAVAAASRTTKLRTTAPTSITPRNGLLAQPVLIIPRCQEEWEGARVRGSSARINRPRTVISPSAHKRMFEGYKGC
jgi:hypothetical protein